MICVRFIVAVLLVVLCFSVTACAANVFVPVPPLESSTGDLPAADIDANIAVITPGVSLSQVSPAAELLSSIATPAAPQHPDFASLASAPDAGVAAQEAPDFERVVELMNNTSVQPQLLADHQAARRNRLYEALRTRSSAIFVLEAPRCKFDSAQGFVIYENFYINMKA